MQAARIGSVTLALACLAAPAVAHAASVGVKDGILTYQAAPGEQNSEVISPPATPGPMDYPGPADADAQHFGVNDTGASVTPGSGCEPVTSPPYPYYEVRCAAEGVTAIRIYLGDGRDLGGSRSTLPVSLFGGSGDDFWLEPPAHGYAYGDSGGDSFAVYGDGDSTISGGPGTDTVDYSIQTSYPAYHDVGARVSLDGQPGDGSGPGQQYNVMPDVENVHGGSANDELTGSGSANWIDGDLGSDTIAAGAGNDTIDAVDVYHDGDGHHPPLDYQPTRDAIGCGPGRDTVKADMLDAVSPDCERVFRYTIDRVYDEDHAYYFDRLRVVRVTLRGSDGPDRLTGEPKSPNRIFGFGGDDLIAGGRRSDYIDAGAGADTVRTRDSSVDTVSCGSGRDLVVADRDDDVARNCERVSRR